MFSDYVLNIYFLNLIFFIKLLGEADDFGFVTNGLFANWTTMDVNISEFYFNNSDFFIFPFPLLNI